MDATTVWIIIAVVVVALVVLGVVYWMSRRKRTNEVRQRFGPEYDRQVQERGNKRAAEAHLQEVAERRDQLTIRPLSESSRQLYLQRWQAVQADFVDRPGEAVDAADRLVTDVMSERGYPGTDFESRSELMAADHPEVVDQYRRANDARRRHHDSDDSATTEELRRAMVHYRELVTLLVEDQGREGSHRAPDRPDQADRADQPDRPQQPDDPQEPGQRGQADARHPRSPES